MEANKSIYDEVNISKDMDESNIKEFIENERVVSAIKAIKKDFREMPRNASDIYDGDGNQYVDLVQEGGGILGIALIGYIYALEEVGIRFYSLAGTSAGAINAAFLAAIGKPNEKKAKKMLDILQKANLVDFLDGGSFAMPGISSLLKEKVKKGSSKKHSNNRFLSCLFCFLKLPLISFFYKAVKLPFKIILLFPFLVLLSWLASNFFCRKKIGINRGEVFFDWLKKRLSELGVKRTDVMIQRMNDFPSDIQSRTGVDFDIKSERNKAKLAIIASDITTLTKTDFPRMAHLYYDDPDAVNPANYVRASMSLPGVFDPLIVKVLNNLKKKFNTLKKDWRKVENGSYFGDIPDEFVFVDGGVMSNFPIDIFHVRDKVPLRPTFGIKLGYDRQTSFDNKKIAALLMNSFNAARQIRDHEFLLKNQDYIRLFEPIDDRGINWLNFNLPQEEKVELFVRGVEAARKFLKRFDWEDYKLHRSDALDKSSKARNSTEAFSAQLDSAFKQKTLEVLQKEFFEDPFKDSNNILKKSEDDKFNKGD